MARTSLSLPFSGAKLRKLRELRGWNQQDVSERMTEIGRGVYRDRISRYETGASKPSARTFGALVEIFGCDETDLLEDAS